LGRLSKRADILQAGVELFHQRGYGTASVESIAEAAGVPKGSFFNHFHSKEEFAHEAIEAYFAPLAKNLEGILSQDDIDAKQKLLLMLRVAKARAGGCYEGCMLGNLSLELSNQSEPLRLLLSSVFGQWSKFFERVVREGQSSGAFNAAVAPERASRFIVNCFQGSVLRSKVDKADHAAEDFEEFVLSTLVVR
jgi:TetR/AcrR family transcriptional repressor of nem operon